MQSRIDREPAINALLMAVWRRRPSGEVLVHSENRAASYDWQAFPKERHSKASMRCRGNFHDNAVAESFFPLLLRERVHGRIFVDRQAARRDFFEMFCNSKRRQGNTTNGLRRPRSSSSTSTRSQATSESGRFKSHSGLCLECAS